MNDREATKRTIGVTKAVVGAAVAVVIAFAGGGAAGTKIATSQDSKAVTVEQLNAALTTFRLELERTTEPRIRSLEARALLADAQIASINAEVRPALASIQNSVTQLVGDIQFIRGRMEKP